MSRVTLDNQPDYSRATDHSLFDIKRLLIPVSCPVDWCRQCFGNTVGNDIGSGGPSMAVSASLRMQPHLNDEEDEQGTHHDDSRKRSVQIREQRRQTWIVQRLKCRRQKLLVVTKLPSSKDSWTHVDKCGSNEYSRTKVFAFFSQTNQVTRDWDLFTRRRRRWLESSST